MKKKIYFHENNLKRTAFNLFYHPQAGCITSMRTAVQCVYSYSPATYQRT